MRVIRFESSRLCKTALTVALGLGAIMMSTQALAGCGGWTPPAAPNLSSSWNPPATVQGGFMSAVYRSGGDGQFLRVGDLQEQLEGIVGTWRFTWTSDGTAYPQPIPFGAPVDFGTHQWHSDKTEIITSGGRPPSSGDVCMGVWKQTGRFTYKMKHIALAWLSSDSTPSSTPATYVGPAIMTESVTLSRAGDSYEGTFTLDQYAKDEITLIEHISGKVEATRFTVD
jgi:hypothetical protein